MDAGESLTSLAAANDIDTYPEDDSCGSSAVCADSAELTRKAEIMPGEDLHAALLASCPPGSRDRATGSAVDVSTDDRTGAASRVHRK